MRVVVQRVSQASVAVDGTVTGQIDRGLLVLVGVQKEDTQQDLSYIYQKTVGLRIFEDQDHKMNLSLTDVDGQLLVVSQFTLLGDVRRGKRPSFGDAADPAVGKALYEQFIQLALADGIETQTGIFQSDMQVSLINDGPVTILLDSRKQF